MMDKMMDATRPSGTKRQLLEQLLDQGMVLVALDARTPGVALPAHLADDPQLRLNLSYRFGLPMCVDDLGIHATLTFSGVQSEVDIPWRAVFLMASHVTGQPYLFLEDVPRELASSAAHGSAQREVQEETAPLSSKWQATSTPQRKASESAKPAARHGRAQLRLVHSADDGEPNASVDEAPQELSSRDEKYSPAERTNQDPAGKDPLGPTPNSPSTRGARARATSRPSHLRVVK